MQQVESLIREFQAKGLGGQLLYEPDQPLNNIELERLSRELRPYRLERDATGLLLLMSPTSKSSARVNNLICHFLTEWALASGQGTVYGPDTGFQLADTSVRSPDAAWLNEEVLQARSSEGTSDPTGFVQGCPVFVVEVISPSDSLRSQHKKMEMWMRNGARLGWLIDPVDEAVWIYRPSAEPEMRAGFDRSLSGEGVLPGFELDLRRLRVG